MHRQIRLKMVCLKKARQVLLSFLGMAQMKVKASEDWVYLMARGLVRMGCEWE